MIFYNGHKVYMNGKYPAIWLDGKSQHVHVVEWERHNGSVPKGMIVHHKDENKMNWNIDNLELLTRSEHIKKHSDIVHRKGIKIIAIKDGKEITFSSIKDAAAGCGTYPVLVARVLNGTQRQSKGWIFRKVG